MRSLVLTGIIKFVLCCFNRFLRIISDGPIDEAYEDPYRTPLNCSRGDRASMLVISWIAAYTRRSEEHDYEKKTFCAKMYGILGIEERGIVVEGTFYHIYP